MYVFLLTIKHMYNFVLQSRKERIMQRNRCERLTEILEWKKLNLYYSKARILAVERTHPDKLKFFKQFDDSCLNFQSIGRSLSLTSPKMSEYSSEDEYCHLWGGKTDINHVNFDNFYNLNQD
uniref:Glycogen [starch] synthase n=1 Tax=Myxobolus squamalis TaxID=59785 RepID=A0A6B2GBG1_MYXSQ